MPGKVNRGWKVWILAGLLVLVLTGSVRAESVSVQVTPDVIEISSFYQGAEIALTGSIPAGYQAVAEVTGPARQERLMRKGRRGPLWMNVGELTVSGAPSLYLVSSSEAGLLTGDSPWGLKALAQRLTLGGQVEDREKAKFTEQFLELKQSESLYGAWPGGLQTSPAEDGRVKVTGKFWLPANVKPDTYKVCLIAVQEGKAAGRQCADLPIKMVGFPALLMTLAFEHAALYGILAVVIAIVTGFIMGYLFKGGGGH
uniref:Transmembrane protein n=1 Tax=Desulfobacca acetoxidans TaxID=60893 RepID=A0A7C3ZCV4_9BACT